MTPPTWHERLTDLREAAHTEPHRAGQDGLRVFEDWLFENAQRLGLHNRGHGGMREYIEFISKRGRLSKEEAARALRFADVRNCLAHRAGLLMSAGLTDELLSFLETLFRREAWDAEHLMTPRPHTVREQDNLRVARDWMLAHNVSRLPVVRDKQRVVGLLTNRDILALQAAETDTPTDASPLTVADAMSADSLEQVLFLPRRAPYAEVLGHLKKPEIAALFVTEGGSPHQPLLGIISVSDILPKL